MKIALVILDADPSRGGAERYTVDLAAALARRGHDVSLLACAFGAGAFAGEMAGVRNVPMDSPGATRARRYARFLDSLDAHLDRTRYDVVHAMLPVRRCDVYHPHAGMAAEQMGKWNRLFNPRRVAMANVERELLLGVDPPITIALSEYVKRSILKSYPLPDDRLATLFNAVDLNRYQPGEPGGHGPPVALFIAQDFDRKGLGTLIAANEAIEEMAPAVLPSIRVVGRGDIKHWRHVANSFRGGARIEFAGPVEETRLEYQKGDFFVLPTRHDPCSLVVLEALAMGLPVISTVFNGATEIMTDGVHGFVLQDPTDVDALADAMRKMLDPATRSAMRDACLALRPGLSYDRHLDALIAIYERSRTRI